MISARPPSDELAFVRKLVLKRRGGICNLLAGLPVNAAARLSGKQLNRMEEMMVTARAKAVKEVMREQRIQQEPGLFIVNRAGLNELSAQNISKSELKTAQRCHHIFD